MKQWREIKEKVLADKKLRVLLLVFAAGIALLLLSGLGSGGSRSQTAANDDYYEIRAAVEASLESRVAKLLSTVEGVGKVKVLVTVDSLQEYSFAQNSASGGTGDRSENDYVIVEENGSENGLALTVTSPVVRGVAVSCEGGGSAKVRQEVVFLVCAALGVSASKVYVSKLAQ